MNVYLKLNAYIYSNHFRPLKLRGKLPLLPLLPSPIGSSAKHSLNFPFSLVRPTCPHSPNHLLYSHRDTLQVACSELVERLRVVAKSLEDTTKIASDLQQENDHHARNAANQSRLIDELQQNGHKLALDNMDVNLSESGLWVRGFEGESGECCDFGWKRGW